MCALLWAPLGMGNLWGCLRSEVLNIPCRHFPGSHIWVYLPSGPCLTLLSLCHRVADSCPLDSVGFGACEAFVSSWRVRRRKRPEFTSTFLCIIIISHISFEIFSLQSGLLWFQSPWWPWPLGSNNTISSHWSSSTGGVVASHCCSHL